MSWHCGWPGKLAAFACETPAIAQQALRDLRIDFQAFKDARALAAASTVLDRAVRRSSFQHKLMAEVTALACESPAIADSDVLEQLGVLARQAFSGWGQTKIIEDGLKELRHREEHDTTNAHISKVRQWASLRDAKVIGLHKLQELEAAENPDVEAPPKLSKHAFTCRGAKPSIAAESMVGSATWPTMSAQSGQILQAEQQLMRQCRLEGCWENAGACWKCVFTTPGTLLRHRASGDLRVVLGDVMYVALLAWSVDRVVAPNGEIFFFLSHQPVGECSSWLVLCDFEEWAVVPTEVLPPS